MPAAAEHGNPEKAIHHTPTKRGEYLESMLLQEHSLYMAMRVKRVMSSKIVGYEGSAPAMHVVIASDSAVACGELSKAGTCFLHGALWNPLCLFLIFAGFARTHEELPGCLAK